MSYYILRTNTSGSFIGANGGEAIKFFGLPLPRAIRFRFSDSTFDPNTITGMAHVHTWTKVPGISTNDWEYYQKNDASFHNAFYEKFTDANNLVTIIDSDLTSVTDISGIFYGCTSLQNSDLKNTGSVTNMMDAFYGCSGIASISNLLDTSEVTNMTRAFYGCTSITSIPTTLNTSKVTNMFAIFGDCTSLTSIPSTFDTSNATNLRNAFYGCTSLTEIPTTISLASATDIGGMFYGCSNVSSGILAFYNRAITKNNKPAFEIMGDTYIYSTDILKGTGSNTTAGANEAKQTSYDYTSTLLTDYVTPHTGNVVKLRSKIVMNTPLRKTWTNLRVLTADQTPSSYTEMCARWYNNATDTTTQNRYGLFYNWSAIKYLIDNPSVISGWHIPTVTEYNTMINEFGGRTGLGWEYISYVTDIIPGHSSHYGATGFNGYFAGYCDGTTWKRNGVLMLNWTSTVVASDPNDKPNRFFCVCKEQIGGVEDSVGDATFMHMDAETGNNLFFQVVVFKD
jgi:uncharacterized protein (TIGR02145 family)